MNDSLSTQLSKLPNYSGVYLMMDQHGVILYVGKAKNLKKRVLSYFKGRQQDRKTQSLVSQIVSLDWIVTQNEREAIILECQLIKKNRPKYNILLRDDKSFPYIRISSHPFPALTLYRGVKSRDDTLFGPYPNTKVARDILLWLQKNFKIRNCSASFFNARTRPCLQYQINRCTAPCVDFIAPDEYQLNIQRVKLFLQGKNHELLTELQEEMQAAASALNYEKALKSREIIRHLHKLNEKQVVDVGHVDADVLAYEANSFKHIMFILSIRQGRVLHTQHIDLNVMGDSAPSEIMESFILQYYFSEAGIFSGIYPTEIITSHALTNASHISKLLAEQFKRSVTVMQGLRGKRKDWLQMAATNANEKLRQLSSKEMEVAADLLEFKDTFQLKRLPERIECYDISHHHGESSVGSMVVFQRLLPSRTHYRLFNIKQAPASDDLSALREVLTRRFSGTTKNTVPELILIDGGELQLHTAYSVLQETGMSQIDLLSVSKGVKRKAGFETIHQLNATPRHLPETSRILHAIQFARDEAHRFAITRHRKQQRSKRVQSVLEQIEGIGTLKRRALLLHFGGIQALIRASLDDIARVTGIGMSLAKRIYSKLHE